METRRSVDICIVGAGPAGAVAARILARRSHRVLVLTRPPRRAIFPFETLGVRAQTLLHELGLESRFQDSIEPGPEKRGIRWGSEPLQWTAPDQHSLGVRILRDRFDEELRSLALSAGAEIEQVVRVEECGDESGLWLRASDAQGNGLEVRSRAFLLATGRAAGIAPCPSEVVATGPKTYAVIGRGHALPGFEDSSCVEGDRHGWSWFLSSPKRGAAAAVFIPTQRLRSMGPSAAFKEACTSASGPLRAFQIEELSVVDVTSRLRRSLGVWVPLGDASCTIDPISSQGLQKALANGRQVAEAVGDAIENGKDLAEVLGRAYHSAAEAYSWHARSAAALHSSRES